MRSAFTLPMWARLSSITRCLTATWPLNSTCCIEQPPHTPKCGQRGSVRKKLSLSTATVSAFSKLGFLRKHWKILVASLIGGFSIAAWAEVPEPDVSIKPNGWHVVVNMPQTRLFVYQDGQLKKSYAVAVGKMLTQTPTGRYGVTGIFK